MHDALRLASSLAFRFALLTLCAAPSIVHAVQVCDVDGQSVNPNHGGTTAGKTGLMRCREGEGGPLVREQELRNGVFMGIVRYYKEGQLQREHSVNERGNRDGRAREYEGRQLVSEETLRNGTTVGLARRWYAEGTLRRVSFHGDDGRSQAEAEFTKQGRLRELRCAPQPLLAPDVDDATWCGHRGSAGTATLYAESGKPRGTLVHERGERRRSEFLWDNGQPREQAEFNPADGVERGFSEAGVKRRERRWVMLATDGKPPRRATTIEREYHENGTLVRERQWKPSERGELLLEQHWYLNGQLKDKQAYQDIDGRPTRNDTSYYDNGKLASEGLWLLAARYDRQALGIHKSFDSDGRLRFERHHDARGRVNREREYDEAGKLVRDDELFEDGSRKAFKTSGT